MASAFGRTWISPALLCGGIMAVGLVAGVAVGILTASFTWITALSGVGALIGGLLATRQRAKVLAGAYRRVDGAFVVAIGWLVDVVIVAVVLVAWMTAGHPQDSGWFMKFVGWLVAMWMVLQLLIGQVASASIPSAAAVARRQG